jgi:nitroreductase
MEFLELAKKRYSVRKYKQQQVEEDKLLKILEAGRVVPTGANKQPQRLVVVKSEIGLAKLNKGANTFGAPVVIIVCADKSETWVRPFDKKNISDIDASIVTDHMMLQAAELGIGSVWICYFDPKIIKEQFNIAEDVEPVNILALGYAADQPQSPDRHKLMRKPLKHTVVYESF